MPCAPVLFTGQITIPQYCESTITATVKLPDNLNVLFQPSTDFSQKPVFVPNALIRIKNDQTQSTTINTTDHPYTLSPNTRLGTASPFLLACTITPLLSSTFSVHQSHMISHHRSNSSHQCYVCHQTFLSKNNLYHHLRTQYYSSELRHQIEALTKHINPLTNRTKIQHILWIYGKLFDICQSSKINTTLDLANEINT